MIKIISKKEYEEINNRIVDVSRKNIELEHNLNLYKKRRDELLQEITEAEIVVSDLSKHLDEVVTENEKLKKEKVALKSKVTRLENQIKKLQDEQNKDKKLVKETLKEVHKAHAKRAKKED